MKRAVFVLFFVFSLLTSAMATPALKGTFIQSWLAASYSAAQWNAEFDSMQAVGMDTLIVQTTMDEVTNQNPPSYSPTTKWTMYPSSISGTTYRGNAPGTSISPIELILQTAEARGIKVYIGLNWYDSAWFYRPSSPGVPFIQDSYWCGLEAARGNTMASEMYSAYKASYPNAFYGWYWPWEVDNADFGNSYAKNALISMMNANCNYLKSLDSSMPILVSPFYNNALGTASSYKQFWISVLGQLTNYGAGDIFAPQDGVGAGHSTVGQVTTWYTNLANAVATKTGLQMWSNTENFQDAFSGGGYVPADVKRVANQFNNAAPYVSNFLTFSYSHYSSPQVVNPAFQDSWVNYAVNGTVSTATPTKPGTITATGQVNGKIVLSWVTNPSANGDTGFRIWRNDVLIGQIEIPNAQRSANAPISFTDPSTSANGAHNVYKIDAFDVNGNISAKKQVTGP
ncbi:hypothetical protein BH11ARM1_BH11ARM1_08930 [soil metagenome]